MSSIGNKFYCASQNILNVHFSINNAPHPVEYFYHDKRYTFDHEEFIRTKILPYNMKTNLIILGENSLINEKKEKNKTLSSNKLNDEQVNNKNELCDSSVFSLNLPFKLNEDSFLYYTVVEDINGDKIKNPTWDNNFCIEIPKNEFDILCKDLN